jgi:hypothetical protein
MMHQGESVHTIGYFSYGDCTFKPPVTSKWCPYVGAIIAAGISFPSLVILSWFALRSVFNLIFSA